MKPHSAEPEFETFIHDASSAVQQIARIMYYENCSEADNEAALFENRADITAAADLCEAFLDAAGKTGPVMSKKPRLPTQRLKRMY